MTVNVQELTTNQQANGVQTKWLAGHDEADDLYRYG